MKTKNPAWCIDVCVVFYAVETQEQARTIKTQKQVRKKYKERRKEGIQNTKQIIPNWIFETFY